MAESSDWKQFVPFNFAPAICFSTQEGHVITTKIFEMYGAGKAIISIACKIV